MTLLEWSCNSESGEENLIPKCVLLLSKDLATQDLPT